MATITDFSNYGHNGTTVGTASVDNSIYKFGGGSLFCPTEWASGGNAQSYVQVSPSSDWDFGSGDFTIETWFRPPSWSDYAGGGTVLVNLWKDGNNFWQFWSTKTNIGYQCISGGSWVTNIYSDTVSSMADSWHHLAVVRNGNTWYLFIDGVNKNANLGVGSLSATQWFDAAANLYIGTGKGSGWNDHPNWVDEVRISKGIARWTSNFTPPSSAY